MKNLIMVCALVLGAQVAQAGGFVEPYIGYANAKWDGTLVAGLGGGTTESKIKGPVYGLRAGYQFILPWVALEASQFKGKDDASPSQDVKTTDIGFTAGLNLPIVRPYAGYVFSSKSEVGNSEYTGTAMKLGVGLGFIPLIYVNIEMVDTKFKEVDGVDIGTIFSDVKAKTTAFTISYVF